MPSHPAAPGRAHGPRRFRVATWNCFGQGQGLGAVTQERAPHRRRLAAPQVAAECAAADVLCVQELLSRDAQRFFDGLAGSGYAATIRDDNRLHVRSGTVRGSGLGLCARAPLERSRLHTYGRAGVSWDRLARKGAIHALVRLAPGLDVDVVTTHLQSGAHPRALRVRWAQLEELRRLVAEVAAADRALVVCGDFNVDGHRAAREGADYRRLADALAGLEDLGARDDLPTYHPHPDGNTLAHRYSSSGRPERLDYVFWRAPRSAPAVRCTGIERFFDRPLEPAGPGRGARWASDHFGLRATFEVDGG